MKEELEKYLNILQIEEYEIVRFVRWVKKNTPSVSLEGKKPLVWTIKAKFLYHFSLVLFPITIFWPWLSLIIGTIILKIPENIYLECKKYRIKNTIQDLKKRGLKVIGVSGSYGKTSTKEILYTLLSGKYRVYRTPESFNNIKGVIKAIDLELDGSYQIFICEMGEYKRGDVREICEIADPDLGIITGVNEQHAERMGNIENALETVYELADWINKKNGFVLVNGERIKKAGFNEYGLGNYQTPLEQNVEGVMVLAKKLGMSDKELDLRKKLIKPFKHRLELKKRGELTILDDTYNSNPDGFRKALDYLQKFPKPRVVVTPGIIELGKETEFVHQNIGQYMNGKVDLLVLVGQNERTENLAKNFSGKYKYIGSIHDYQKAVDEVGTILFENDLPDNY